jgi:CubicO group peptidase (beta-lactamase class C family)
MWIASCTKLASAICILKLAEDGFWSLDDEVAEIGLPELKNKEILVGWDENDDPILKPSKTPITLRMMLSQTSGIAYGWNSQPDVFKYIGKLTKKRGRRLDPSAFESLPLVPLLAEPGTTWAYGANLEWIGLLLERKLGKRFHQFMDETVVRPLGLNNTTFRLEQREDMNKARADLTIRIPKTGMLVPSPTMFYPDVATNDMAGGGLWSSPADYTKLLQAVLRNDGTLAKPETINLLFEPQLSPVLVQTLQDTLYKGPDAEFLSTNLPKSTNLTQAIGGMICQEPVVGDVFGNGGQRRSKGSLNWGGLPNLMWTIDRQKGVALFYGSQIIPAGDNASIDAFRRFEEAIYAAETEKAKL